MVEQANEIVKLYAGDATNNDNDDIKDKCHVASALFLGPTIHMMCGQKVNDVRQTAYCRYKIINRTTESGDTYTWNPSFWNNSPYNEGPNHTDGEIKPECKDWIDLNADEESDIINGTYHTGKIQQINNSKNVSGQPSGLCYKFKQYMETWQGRQDGVSTRTVKSNVLSEQKKMSFGLSDDESIATMSLRDGGSSGGTSHSGTSTGGGDPYKGHKISYSSRIIEKHADIFCGVPVYNSTGDLKYGGVSGDNYKKYSDNGNNGNIFKPEYNLFTYDISKENADIYEWPFA